MVGIVQVKKIMTINYGDIYRFKYNINKYIFQFKCSANISVRQPDGRDRLGAGLVFTAGLDHSLHRASEGYQFTRKGIVQWYSG